MLTTTLAYNIIPVFYAYIIAYEAYNFLGDDIYLGTVGSQFIRKHTRRILERYESQSSNISAYIGRYANVIFLIEPDFWE